jgi:hypothetical protein
MVAQMETKTCKECMKYDFGDCMALPNDPVCDSACKTFCPACEYFKETEDSCYDHCLYDKTLIYADDITDCKFFVKKQEAE